VGFLLVEWRNCSGFDRFLRGNFFEEAGIRNFKVKGFVNKV
jgi:hypothetical protein